MSTSDDDHLPSSGSSAFCLKLYIKKIWKCFYKKNLFLFRDSYRVVGFEVDTFSVDKDELKFVDDSCTFPAVDTKSQLVNEDTGTKLYFTYSVEWSESDISWASRWDIYLDMKDVQIHWFSIVNSIVVLFFLSGKIIWSLYSDYSLSNSYILKCYILQAHFFTASFNSVSFVLESLPSG